MLCLIGGCRTSDESHEGDILAGALGIGGGATVRVGETLPTPGFASACRSGSTRLVLDPTYERQATVGDTEDIWFLMPHGVVVDSQEDVWTFDTGADVVWHFSADLTLENRFGSQGEGPGEFSPQVLMGYEGAVDRGQMEWIHPMDSAVVVYDGARLQRFTRTGEYLDAIDASLPVRPPRKIMIRGDTVYHAWGGYNIEGPWVLKAVVGDTWTERFTFTLVGDEMGPVRYMPPDQAFPIWNVRGDCMVMTRGDVEEFVLVDLTTNTFETIHVGIPEPEPSSGGPLDEDMARELGALGVETTEALALARVIDLVIDPSGVLWIQTAAVWPLGVERREVVRVALATGEQTLDTLPSFPQTFGADGRYYGIRRSLTGEFFISLYAPQALPR